MKKTIKTIILLAIVMFLVTGCSMKTNVGLDISKDKTVTVKVISAMDDEMIDYSIGMDDENASEGKTYTDAERWAYVESSLNDNSAYQEYTKERYDQDGYKGYVYTLELGNINDLSTTNADDPVAFDSLSKDSKLFIKNGNKYSLNISGSSDEEIEQAKNYSQYGAVFDLKFYVSLPNPAISNNATSISDDKLTYTWDLLTTQNFDLTFSFGGISIPIIVGIIGAVIVVAVVIIVVAKKSKNKSKQA